MSEIFFIFDIEVFGIAYRDILILNIIQRHISSFKASHLLVVSTLFLFIENYHDISMTPSYYTERHLTQIPGRIINKEDKLQIARREKIWQVPFCIKRI